MSQICTQCGENLPLSEFYVDRGKPIASCKPCKRISVDKKRCAVRKAERDARNARWLAEYPRVWHMLDWAGGWHKEESWRPIPRYMGLYEASNWGRVRSLWFINGRAKQLRRMPLVLTPFAKPGGYHTVTLVPAARVHCTEQVYVLVLEAFVGPRPDGHVCAHYDGNPNNNTLTNLRWATYKENEADKARHGRGPVGERNPAAKLTGSQVRLMRSEYAAGSRQCDLARRYAVSRVTVNRIVTGKLWRISDEKEELPTTP